MPKRFKSIVQRATINKYRVCAVDTGVDIFPDRDCKFGVGRQEMRVEALITVRVSEAYSTALPVTQWNEAYTTTTRTHIDVSPSPTTRG